MSQRSPVVVIGGTRGTGLLIARLLVRQGIPVRVLARDRVAGLNVLEPAVEVIGGDITRPETLPPALAAAQHIVADTIVRTGMLLNRRPGRAISLTQKPLPLSPRYRIARADVAEAFVAALDHPRAVRTTFEIVWRRGERRESWPSLMANLQPDAA